MVAYSFQRRFVDHVLAGLEPGPWCPGMKRHTLRKPRAGRSKHARPEQPLHLYTAMRTKQCRLIGKAVARVQMPVQMVWTGKWMSLMRAAGPAPRSYVAQLAPIVQHLLEAPHGTMLLPEEMDSFARTDGFADAADMAAYFEPPAGPHTLDLVLIGWAPGEPL